MTPPMNMSPLPWLSFTISLSYSTHQSPLDFLSLICCYTDYAMLADYAWAIEVLHFNYYSNVMALDNTRMFITFYLISAPIGRWTVFQGIEAFLMRQIYYMYHVIDNREQIETDSLYWKYRDGSQNISVLPGIDVSHNKLDVLSLLIDNNNKRLIQSHMAEQKHTQIVFKMGVSYSTVMCSNMRVSPLYQVWSLHKTVQYSMTSKTYKWKPICE